MLLLMRQREIGCKGWTRPDDEATVRHDIGRWPCHGCSTRPQDIFDALYAEGDKEKKEIRRLLRKSGAK